ncbi:MAG TPA: hypothetical protein VND90_03825 [Terracidiphilus sp.]|nr:hypothetical protein [Terracidiphilus sp.]
MKRLGRNVATWIACGALAAAVSAPAQSAPQGSTSDPWSAPAAALAHRISGLLGPGPVQFSLTNLSSLTPADVAAIRRLLGQDLESGGILFGGPDSANILRITLSENPRERLWIAEIVEGTETQVVMVKLSAAPAAVAAPAAALTLRMQPVFASPHSILSVLQTPNGLVVLEPEQLLVESRAGNGWQTVQHIDLPQNRPLSRDPRGRITPSADGQGFSAYTGGAACQGTYSVGLAQSGWTFTCSPSDDPWPLFPPAVPSAGSGAPVAANVPIKAFFNAQRDFFTGVVTPAFGPAFGIDLPPFYSAALLPRPAAADVLLLTAVDGRVLLANAGALQPIAGTRDWGSDVAALRSGCGAGTQILVSGSGQAVNDSLRAYSLTALEAVPASAPLTMNGSVTALFSAPDGSSVLAIVRTTDNQYEGYRVSALCN